MKPAISVEEWNREIVALVQAMSGAISSNFRMVTITHDGEGWVLKFYIEKENAIDAEAIDNIGFKFSVLHNGEFGFRQETIITTDQLKYPESPEFAVFRRRQFF